MDLAERLKEAREVSGLSVRALALRADVSHAAVHHSETGYSIPRADNLARIARALDVSADWLLGLRDD